MRRVLNFPRGRSLLGPFANNGVITTGNFISSHGGGFGEGAAWSDGINCSGGGTIAIQLTKEATFTDASGIRITKNANVEELSAELVSDPYFEAGCSAGPSASQWHCNYATVTAGVCSINATGLVDSGIIRNPYTTDGDVHTIRVSMEVDVIEAGATCEVYSNDNVNVHTITTAGTHVFNMQTEAGTEQNFTIQNNGTVGTSVFLSHVSFKIVEVASTGIDATSVTINAGSVSPTDQVLLDVTWDNPISAFDTLQLSYDASLGDFSNSHGFLPSARHAITNCIAAGATTFDAYVTPVNLVASNTFTLTGGRFAVDWGDGTYVDYAGPTATAVATGAIHIISDKAISNIQFTSDSISRVQFDYSSTITSMNSTFKGNSKLEAVTGGPMTVNNITDYTAAFEGCAGLTFIPPMDTTNGTLFISMFKDCVNLTCLGEIDTTNYTDTANMFLNTPALGAPDFAEQSALLTGDHYINPGECVAPVGSLITAVPLNFVDAVDFDIYGSVEYSLDGGNTFTPASGGPVNIKGVPSGDVIVNAVDAGVTQISFMSKDFFSAVTLIEETGTITTASAMFGWMPSCTSFDLTKFNTSNVTSFYRMFMSSTGFTSVDLSNFDTANANSMDSMFRSCSGLTSLDLSSFNTSKVTTFNSFTQSCSNIESIDMSNFNFGAVTDFSYMLRLSPKLVCITNIDTTSGGTTTSMFSGNDLLIAPNASEQTAIEGGSAYTNPGACP